MSWVGGRSGSPCRPNAAQAAVLTVLLQGAGTAAAFPLIDPTNQDQVPAMSDLSSDDAHSLLRQLQLADGLLAPPGGGWTFVPRLDLQEELTDNVLQQHSPRRADLATFLTPGLGIAADTPRLQLTFDIAPSVAIYARDSALNLLTEQLNGVGLLTAVPDWAYLDIRAAGGVHGEYGGLGSLGTLGSSAFGSGVVAPGSIDNLAGANAALTRDNAAQTETYSVSPYLLHQFGDAATVKLGYSFGLTQSDQISSFAPSPFPTGGAGSQSLTSNEETLHVVSGEVLPALQNSFDIDLQQSDTHTGAGYLLVTGNPAQRAIESHSDRSYITDQVTYAVSRKVSLFVSGGYEWLDYSDSGIRPIDDLTWSAGVTLTPNPDSQLTLSYGHRDGYNSLSADGHYRLTSRTLVSLSYGSSFGTQLQSVQSQLALAAAGQQGNLINGQTGGALFTNVNGLLLQDGVFRTDTFVLGSQTSLGRDVISLQVSTARQSSVGAGSNTRATSRTIGGAWLHEMNQDMSLSASAAVTWASQGIVNVTNPGNNTSFLATLAWQYRITPTLTGNVRYSFFDRQAEAGSYTAYQNLILLGISKTF